MLALVVAAPAKAGHRSVVVTGNKVTLEYLANADETNTVTIIQTRARSP